MVGKKVNPENKIYQYPIGLERWQIDWLEQQENQDFHVSDFFRQKLKEYIKIRQEIKGITHG